MKKGGNNQKMSEELKPALRKKEETEKTDQAKEERKKNISRTAPKTANRPLTKSKIPQKLDQSKSKLLKIPPPLQTQIFLLTISSGKEFLKIILLCKRVKDFLSNDPRLWLSLLLHKFPASLGTSQQALKSRLADGYLDSSKDWKIIYIKEYLLYLEKSNEQRIKKLIANCKSTTAHKFFEEIKKVNLKVCRKSGKTQTPISQKNIKIFDQTLLIKVDYETPTQKLDSLSITLLSKTLVFEVKNKISVQEGNISIVNNDFGMEIQLSGDTYTQYWTIPYTELFAQLVSYSPKPFFDNISSNLGLIDYSLHLELHSLDSSLASHIERKVDLVEECEVCEGLIENLPQYRIPKDKLVIDWKSLAFSHKIPNVCIMDVTVFDEQGRLFIWSSKAASIKFVEQNGNDGDGYAFTIETETFSVSAYLRDKGKWFVLVTISLRISKNYIQKYFIRKRNRL